MDQIPSFPWTSPGTDTKNPQLPLWPAGTKVEVSTLPLRADQEFFAGVLGIIPTSRVGIKCLRQGNLIGLMTGKRRLQFTSDACPPLFTPGLDTPKPDTWFEYHWPEAVG